jgi:shikimate dehydrogenase
MRSLLSAARVIANGPEQMRDITGRTRLFGIIADPIVHVQTPQRMNALMRARNYDGVLVPFHVRAEHLADFVASLRRLENFGGFIATVPHKPAMIGLCDEVTEAAKQVGAANVVRREPDGRMIADITDGTGFIAGLRSAGIEPRGQSVYLAGAGGAASAIGFALAQAGVARLTIANRTRAKSEELRGRLLANFPQTQIEIGGPNPAGHALVVNGTSLGLHEGDALPLDPAGLDPAMTVAEIIMEPEETPLIAAARARGCRIQLGNPMLTGQLELWADFLGITP